MSRVRWLFVAGLLLLPRPSFALRLRWESGGANLSFTQATRCTLLVEADPGYALPSEWRLIWVANSASPHPISIISGDVPSTSAGVCEAATGTTQEAVLSHETTAMFCTQAASPRAETARYVLDLPGDLRARLRVGVVTPAGSIDMEPTEATVNGGVDEATDPPVITAASLDRASENVSIRLSGGGLENTTSLTLETLHGATVGEAAITDLTSDSLTSTLVTDAGLPDSRVVLTNTAGFTSAFRLPRDTVGFAPGDNYVIGFRSGTVEPPAGSATGLISDFSFRSSSLRDSLQSYGVHSLQRAFPRFTHADTHTLNLLGEPVLLDDLADIYIASCSIASDRPSAVSRSNGLPDVLYAYSDRIVSAKLFVPNDSLLNQQWPLYYSGQLVCGVDASCGVGANLAWNITKGLPSVGIAIIDGGIDTTHVDMYQHARLLPTTSYPSAFDGYDDDRHGTAVAGIAAAAGNNGLGIAGVAYNATPWGIRALDDLGRLSDASVTSAVATALGNHLPILNFSIGTYSPPYSDWYSVFRNALYMGACPIAAIGNDDASVMIYPAAFTKMVYAVGAVDQQCQRWSNPNDCGGGSNYGPWIDAVAPGGYRVVTDWIGGDPSYYYTYSDCPCGGFSGTSSAAPVAAGIAALVKSVQPTLEGDDLMQVMNNTAEALTDPAPDPTGQYGWGKLRAGSAVSYVTTPRGVVQGWLGSSGTYGQLADSGTVQLAVQFTNDPYLADSTYNCVRHRMVGTVTLGYDFVHTPAMWSRTSSSLGWPDTSAIDYNYEIHWGRVVSRSLTTHGARMETFVYDVRDAGNNHLRWEPCPPESARIAFTMIGQFPASMLAVDEQSSVRLAVHTIPNPSHAGLVISFSLPYASDVRATILDAAGRIVAVPVHGRFSAGNHEVTWDAKGIGGRACAAGVYFLKVDAGPQSIVRKIVLLGIR